MKNACMGAVHNEPNNRFNHEIAFYGSAGHLKQHEKKPRKNHISTNI